MKKRRFVIVLIIILTLIIFVFSSSFLYRHFFLNNKKNYVEIPEEIIDKDESPTIEDDVHDLNDTEDNSNQYAELITIDKGNKFDNKKIIVNNLLPGDYVTNYYSIRVTYQNKISLKFNANLVNDDILSDVLKIKINLMNSDELLYDGFIKDIEDGIDYIINSDKKITEDYYYEISIYLDTNVGNMYQNKKLLVDFEWLVVGTDNLEKP